MNLHELNLDDERRQELEALLSENAGLREKLLSQEPSAQDRVLQILSIVRAFDEPMYEEVCRKFEPDLPEFGEILNNPGVQPVPRVEGKFWLRESLQNYWLSYWNSHADEHRLWACRFAAWLEREGEDPTERLALLLRVDSHQALQLLKTEFEQANAKDDLDLCHSLAQQVDANLARVNADLRPQFEAVSARYRGRARFLREFQRTISYFPRDKLEKDFKELINGDGVKWIFYLSASGGMGKTMFVHRMIAHELLKKTPFPLAARIDLDDIEVTEIARAPWLVAIEIAEEVDEQLAQPLFSKQFLSDVKMFSPLLYRRESNRGRALTDEQRYRLRSLASDQFSRWAGFISRCMELPPGRPVVIFIDTIEEASLHWPAEFRLLLERFEELRAALPQLRLVLSGRYPPSSENDPLFPQRRGHFFQYDDALREQTRFARLGPLGPPEAGGFIRFLLPEVDPELMNTMIFAAAGNPFKLRMLCETISRNPEMTAEKLKEYGSDVDLAYLIKRVVERIPVASELGLRWLLRYGAIPRRLTYSFLQDVLHPLLIDALSGKIEEASEDVPSSKERETWLRSADVMLEPAHLWERLSRYVSDRSWISLQSRDPYTATLHPDVVKPMRRLLKEQPIFGRIHREALAHVEKRKTQEPDRWVELTLAELFHRVQLGDADLVAALVKALDERPSPDDVGNRLEVLREIVKPDGDFSEAPVSVLAHAYYEIADAIAIDANFGYLPSDARREDIRRNLERAVDLNRSADVRLPSFAFKWRDFLDLNIPSVLSVVTDLMLVVTSMEGRARYLLLLGEVFAEGKLSSFVFSILWQIFGGRIDSDRIPSWALMDRAAQAYKRRGSYQTMERYLRLSYGKVPPKSRHYVRIQTQLLEFLVDAACLQDAEAEMSKAAAADTTHGQNLWTLQAEIHLMRRDAWAALRLVETTADKTHHRFHQLRGRALGQLLRIDEASAAFAEAMQTALKSEAPTFIDEIRRDELIFRLFEAGLPAEPASLRLSPARGSGELDLIRAFQIRDNQPACERILEELRTSRYPVPTRIRATIAGVSWGVLPSSVMDDAFVSMLRAVSRGSMRRRLMDPPVLLGRAGPWQLGWFKRWELRVNLESEGSTQAEMMDWVRFGRALLAMGDRKRADAALTNIKVGMGGSAAELAVYRQRCLGDLEAPAKSVEFWSGLASEPGLYVAALVENAERAIHSEDWTTAEQSLEAASSALNANSLHPVLAERCRDVRSAFNELAHDRISIDAKGIDISVKGSLTLADYRCALVTTDAERLLIETAGRGHRRLSTYENEVLFVLSRYAREASPRRLAPVFLANWPASLEDLQEPFAELLQLPSKIDDVLLLALGGASLVAVPWELSLPRSNLPVRIGNGSHEGPVAGEIRQPEELRGAAGLLSSLAEKSWSGPTIGVYRVPYTPSKDMIAQMSLLDERLMASHMPISPDPTSADIIYIMTDIEDSPSLPEPCFPGGMTGALMGRGLQLRRMRGPLPFVVLHSPLIGGVTTAIERTFARNRLAQALVNSGATSGVLATGIVCPAGNPFLQDTLIDCLRRSKQPLEIMQNLRASKTYPPTADNLEEMLGVPASALFLNVETNAR